MSKMTPTDAVNVLKFLERIRATECSPEGADMLQRVEEHLRAWVSKATSEPINDGGPAFPFDEMHDDGTHYHSHPGVSLRDYFAAKALQGMLANQHQYKPSDEDMFARDSYVLADAMLKARKEGGAS